MVGKLHFLVFFFLLILTFNNIRVDTAAQQMFLGATFQTSELSPNFLSMSILSVFLILGFFVSLGHFSLCFQLRIDQQVFWIQGGLFQVSQLGVNAFLLCLVPFSFLFLEFFLQSGDLLMHCR